MKDREWAFFEPFIMSVSRRGGRRGSNHRLVLGGIFWIARTGVQWRDLPEEFGKWSSEYRQFRRWTLASLWEMILEALNESKVVPDQVEMIELRGGTPVIPGRKSRKVDIKVEPLVYALRNHVERCFNKLKCSRRLATRYDKTAANYLAFVQIAAARLWTREFVNRT
jgi:transposase